MRGALKVAPVFLAAIVLLCFWTVNANGQTRLAQQDSEQFKVWTDQTTVQEGQPFWIYLEASGKDVGLPQRIAVDGLQIDSRNVQTSSSIMLRSGGNPIRTEKRAFYATAQRTGTITIPSFEAVLDGEVIQSDPFEIQVNESSVSGSGDTSLSKEDLVFIRMDVDKREVYQGEPILLTMQLWQIIYRGIRSGTYRGADIRHPSTVGFYVADLEPTSRVVSRNPWQYEVNEQRKLLYPTSTGNLEIGSWHWEGVAQVPSANRQSLFRRNVEYEYALDADPITVTVKPLPPRPANFSGAVGQFDLRTTLGDDSVLQGVPTKLLVVVSGAGNPDAIGEPYVPELEWAYVSDPKRETHTEPSPNGNQLQVVKRFEYTLTPLEPGDTTIPAIEFVYFDPDTGNYVTEKDGPFDVAVQASAEGEQRLVAADDLEQQRGVDILGEDIRPIQGRSESLSAAGGSLAAIPFVAVLPVLVYAGVVVYSARRRRFAEDVGFARAYHAKQNAMKALGEIKRSGEPADALYRALVTFVSDLLNVEGAGLTSDDVSGLLKENDVEETARAQVVRVLRACERARYASQALSQDEIGALLQGAQSSVEQLDAAARREK